MSEERAPHSPAIPMTPAVLVESHEPPAAATPRGDAAIRALFAEVIGRVLTDHDDFEGIASGRLPASVNEGRDTWQVARGWQGRLGALLREG